VPLQHNAPPRDDKNTFSGYQAGLVEQGPVQGAAVGSVKRKKLRRNPLRKARYPSRKFRA
jgi:hypothetical protein